MKNYKNYRIIFLSEVEAKAVEKALSLRKNSNKLTTAEKRAVYRAKCEMYDTPFRNIKYHLRRIVWDLFYVLAFPKEVKENFLNQ
jgi:hypothetical protein